MALGSTTMARIAQLIGKNAMPYKVMSKTVTDQKLLDRLHWDNKRKTYNDYGLHTSAVKLVRVSPPQPNLPCKSPVYHSCSSQASVGRYHLSYCDHKINQALEELKSLLPQGGGATTITLLPLDDAPGALPRGRGILPLRAHNVYQGIAALASSPDTIQCGEHNMLLKGVSQEDYQKHRRELLRLQSVYPDRSPVYQCYGGRAACPGGPGGMQEGGGGDGCWDTAKGRTARPQHTQTPDPGEASRSGRAALPDPRPRPDPAPGHGHSAGHHMFLHGDYDLKIIARQDYYTGPDPASQTGAPVHALRGGTASPS